MNIEIGCGDRPGVRDSRDSRLTIHALVLGDFLSGQQ